MFMGGLMEKIRRVWNGLPWYIQGPLGVALFPVLGAGVFLCMLGFVFFAMPYMAVDSFINPGPGLRGNKR